MNNTVFVPSRGLGFISNSGEAEKYLRKVAEFSSPLGVWGS